MLTPQQQQILARRDQTWLSGTILDQTRSRALGDAATGYWFCSTLRDGTLVDLDLEADGGITWDMPTGQHVNLTWAELAEHRDRSGLEAARIRLADAWARMDACTTALGTLGPDAEVDIEADLEGEFVRAFEQLRASVLAMLPDSATNLIEWAAALQKEQ